MHTPPFVHSTLTMTTLHTDRKAHSRPPKRGVSAPASAETIAGIFAQPPEYAQLRILGEMKSSGICTVRRVVPAETGGIV